MFTQLHVGLLSNHVTYEVELPAWIATAVKWKHSHYC